MISDQRQATHDRIRPRFASRSWIGAALALVGVVMLFLGWYGVSGRSTIAEQLPFLASGTIPGAALVVVAAVVFSGESTRRATDRTHCLVAELHSLLVEEASVAPAETATESLVEPEALVALPASQRYHRTSCALIAGKVGVEKLDSATISRRNLVACTVCEPAQPAV